MKSYAIVFAAVLIAGCASVAPSQSYRPANYSGAPFLITGSYNDFSGEVEVSVNGMIAAKGSISPWSGTGEFAGAYDGRPMQVSCTISQGLFVSHTVCQVFISGERAAALTF